MNGMMLSQELSTIGRRTRRIMGVSAGIHVLVFVCLAMFQRFAPAEPAITEITWLDAPVMTATPSAPPAATARALERVSFRREAPTGDVSPDPQNIEAFEDRLNERLASLQSAASDRPTAISALEMPAPPKRAILAGVSADRRVRPATLTRATRASPRPVALRREAPKIQAAAMAMPAIPEPSPVREPVENAAAEIRRTLADMQLAGPVADRPLVSYAVPRYPDWAKRDAVEGSVNIYFVVMPDGKVKGNVMVQKTSGFEDFDRNATDALLAWRFEPLGGGTGEQWGTITFHYRLSSRQTH